MWWQNLFPDGFERYLMMWGAVGGVVVQSVFGDHAATLLWWLLGFVIVDYVTGTFGALRTGTWESSKSGLGIGKKVIYFGVIAMAHGLDIAFSSLIQIEIIETITICAYLAGEFGSIVENLDKCGLGEAVPAPIRKMIKALNTRVDVNIEKLSSEDKEDRG